MTNSYELVYVNNQMYGHFEDNVFLSYSKEEKKEILSKLEKEIARKTIIENVFQLLLV